MVAVEEPAPEASPLEKSCWPASGRIWAGVAPGNAPRGLAELAGTLSEPGLPPWATHAVAELPEIPVETERPVVILLHLDEARLNVHLRGDLIQHLDGAFDGVQIRLGGLHEKLAEPVVEENSLGKIKVQSQRIEKRPGCLAGRGSPA
jgi:hypothetical protein